MSKISMSRFYSMEYINTFLWLDTVTVTVLFCVFYGLASL